LSLCSWCHCVLDVTMVTSPLVGRGYHSYSMLHNQTHNRVTRIELSVVTQPTKQPNPFLSWACQNSLVGNQPKWRTRFLARPPPSSPPPPAPAPQGAQKGLQPTLQEICWLTSQLFIYDEKHIVKNGASGINYNDNLFENVIGIYDDIGSSWPLWRFNIVTGLCHIRSNVPIWRGKIMTIQYCRRWKSAQSIVVLYMGQVQQFKPFLFWVLWPCHGPFLFLGLCLLRSNSSLLGL
jgi:hypothetical protein